MSNLFYTFLAPFFVTFEILNFMGYKEGPQMDKLNKLIAKDIEEFQKSVKQKSKWTTI